MMQEIGDFEAFAKSLRNFSKWLPDNVMGADIDCVIHAARRDTDKWLVLEFKAGGQKVSTGQRILFDGLRKLGMEVVVVHEHSNDKVFISGDWGEREIKLETFTRLVDAWWREAKS